MNAANEPIARIDVRRKAAAALPRRANRFTPPPCVCPRGTQRDASFCDRRLTPLAAENPGDFPLKRLWLLRAAA
jgi:hypothetical protein